MSLKGNIDGDDDLLMAKGERGERGLEGPTGSIGQTGSVGATGSHIRYSLYEAGVTYSTLDAVSYQGSCYKSECDDNTLTPIITNHNLFDNEEVTMASSATGIDERIVGTIFEVKKPITITHLKAYIKSTDTHSGLLKLRIYNYATTLLQETTASFSAGWVVGALNPSIQFNENDKFIVTKVLDNGDTYSYGVISSKTKTEIVQGKSFVYPSSQNLQEYGMDIEYKSSWLMIASIGGFGPQGPDGAQGLQGPTGPRGDTGFVNNTISYPSRLTIAPTDGSESIQMFGGVNNDTWMIVGGNTGCFKIAHEYTLPESEINNPIIIDPLRMQFKLQRGSQLVFPNGNTTDGLVIYHEPINNESYIRTGSGNKLYINPYAGEGHPMLTLNDATSNVDIDIGHTGSGYTRLIFNNVTESNNCGIYCKDPSLNVLTSIMLFPTKLVFTSNSQQVIWMTNAGLQLTVCNTGTGSDVVRDGNGVLCVTSSSERYKKDISDVTNEDFKRLSASVDEIRLRYFTWRDDIPNISEEIKGTQEIGCISEELNEIDTKLSVKNKEGLCESINTTHMKYCMLASLQDTRIRLKTLETQFAEQNTLLIKALQLIDSQSKKISDLEAYNLAETLAKANVLSDAEGN